MFAIAAAMFWLDPLLALTALSAVPVVALATWIYRRLSSPAYAQARLEIGKVNSTLQRESLRLARRAIAWPAGTGGGPAARVIGSLPRDPRACAKNTLPFISRS